MADITDIQALAQKLNLWHIAKGKINLLDEKLSNLDYLQMVLQKELDLRAEQKYLKNKKASKLPRLSFDFSKLNEGLAWQVTQLSLLSWMEEKENLLILGQCQTGKTALAAYLGETAVSNGYKVYYTSFDGLIRIALNKETSAKAEKVFSYMKECHLLIIDEVLYMEPTREELTALYKTLVFLNETRSILLITNREISGWLDAAEDKHLCQTLVDRIIGSCQFIRLTE